MNADQQDEIEALQIIYSGDDSYKQVEPNQHQFKIGEDGTPHSFVLQVNWPDDYPSTSGPQLSLDVFYNQHLLPDVRERILGVLNEEAQNHAGGAVTYAIVEYAREHIEEIMKDQPMEATCITDDTISTNDDNDDQRAVNDIKARQALTKAQKRRLWDKSVSGQVESRERGWNWVDIIKHLSQTGTQYNETKSCP